MNIVHIHQDYPDGRPYPFTKAVSNLIDSCQHIDPNIKHTVISINRTSNPFKVSVQSFEQGISVVYWAIPLPIIYYWSMKLSASYIFKHMHDLKVDMIHGHKLTCEGVLAYFLAKKTDKPYVLSVRGGSDMHNVKRLSLHKRFFAKVFNHAKKVFWVSAWAKKPIQQSLSISSHKIDESSLLPNICNIDLQYPQQPASQRHGYVTAVSYHQHKRKGITELIATIARLYEKNKAIELNIYGSGEQIYKNEIEQVIAQHKAESFIHLKGHVSQQTLLTAMSHSKGFLLPAINETFGMAYIEALSVGWPILYVENTGIDGYFDNIEVGEKISTLNADELMHNINTIEKMNVQLCEKIKSHQDKKLLSFCSSVIVATDYLERIQ